MVEERNLGDRLVDGVIYVVLILLGLACTVPFIHVISLSLSNRVAVAANAVTLWPRGLQWDNYRYLMEDQIFIHSFGVSVMRVLAGVTLTLLVVVLTAYPLSRDQIHMPGRTAFKFMLLFGMLFGGGLIPYFLSLKNLGLLNKFAVLVIPGALDIFYTIVVMNFFRGIPNEMYEAAVLDGANHLDVLFRVCIPISVPTLATIALFSAVGHWNSWFDGIIFLQRRTQWPLQSYLYSAVTTRTIQTALTNRSGYEVVALFLNATPEGLGAAMVVIASVPIMMVYPFLQRYFVTGLTLGSVKG